jgi:hypothetical protein
MKASQILPSKGLFSFAAALALVLAPTLAAVAGDHEVYQAKFNLTPTVAAPLGSSGKAQLKAKDQAGVTTGQLTIQAKGLLPAIYSVSAILKSDTTNTSVALGSFEVTGSTLTIGSTIVPANPRKTFTVVLGGTSQPFPDGFDPFDVASVSVADPNAVVVLTGDADSGKATLNVIQTVVPGPSAPAAQGKLTMEAVRTKNHERTVSHLFVNGVPPNLPYTVNVNGVAVSQGTSDQNGKIRLGQTPGKHKGFPSFGANFNGFDLQTISLTDSNSAILFSVSL